MKDGTYFCFNHQKSYCYTKSPSGRICNTLREKQSNNTIGDTFKEYQKKSVS